MFDKWNSHVDKFEKIIELYRNHINDKDTLNYIDILEGELILKFYEDIYKENQHKYVNT